MGADELYLPTAVLMF